MLDYQTAKQEVIQLVKRYNEVKDDNKLKYNEEATKIGFIQPLFRALGWNIEDLKEVSPEETISKKRVDYGFRLDGIPKFFLEAKSLIEDIDKPKFIEQAINYSWHKGCTWAILTNFQRISIYNAEWKTSNFFQNHLKTIPCEQFAERFDELWLLSKDAFKQELLDKEAEKWGKKIKKVPITDQLLLDFTKFRQLLSQSIATLNEEKRLTEEILDESVQRILDRLIFIRNAEDRELEEPKLLPIFRNWKSGDDKNLIHSVRKEFDYFDKNYDSSIFDKQICDELDIDNEALGKIISGLYYTSNGMHSYDFSAIEADVLGNIYEQYLGHILNKNKNKATITESYIKRKEQGIYYTPTFVVDYIIKNTLRRFLKLNNKNIEKLKVLDPACGSGSFLIKAFDSLNDYHKYHNKNYTQNKLDLEGEGAYTKRVEILKNNIFGVDLDPQAVDIAQLNLLLKIAEKRQELPKLKQNIKCGNSLIEDSNVTGDRAFNWKEKFEDIMNSGGFDIIIGNPPYGIVFNEKEKRYLEKNLITFKRNNDLYVAFIQRALDILKDGGLFSFIIPNTYLIGSYFNDIKKYILDNAKIIKILDFGNNHIFKDPSVFNSIIVLQKEPNDKNRIENTIEFLTIPPLTEHELLNLDNYSLLTKIPQKEFMNLEWRPKNRIIDKIINKVDATISDFCEVKDIGFNYWSKGRGKKRGDSIGSRVLYEGERKNSKDVPFLKGRDLHRWGYKFGNHWLRYNYKSYLQKKDTFRFSPEFLERSPKIIYRQTADRIIATLDFDKYYLDKTVHLIVPKEGKKIDLFFLLGILNSTFILYFYRETSREEGRTFAQVMTVDVKKLPLKFNTIIEAAITGLVKTQLTLTKRLDELNNEKTNEAALLKEDLAKTDDKIDQLVYELYGITEEGKKIIRAATHLS